MSPAETIAYLRGELLKISKRNDRSAWAHATFAVNTAREALEKTEWAAPCSLVEWWKRSENLYGHACPSIKGNGFAGFMFGGDQCMLCGWRAPSK